MSKSIKKLELSVLLSALLAVSGCGAEDQSNASKEKEDNTTTEEVETQTESSSGETADEMASDLVFVAYATEELLGKYHSYDEFVSNQNGERIIFWSEKSISNFSFIEVGYEDEGNTSKFFSVQAMYSKDEISPEKPLVVTTVVSEGIPNQGISYTDESGEERYFYISYSGVDNSISLEEFINEPPNNQEESNESSNIQEESTEPSSSQEESTESSSSQEESAKSSSELEENISEKTKDYILNGQGDKPYVAQLKWSTRFLENLSTATIDTVYQQFLSDGGTADDIEKFAEYLTYNAPIPSNWQELAKADIYENYGVVVSRFEYLGVNTLPTGLVSDDLYQTYVEVDGTETKDVVISARTGNTHG